MRLCDELEDRQQAVRESRLRLNNALLAPLNKAASLEPAEFEQAVIRLIDNFDTLYDSIDTVANLRSTVLQLAVQGKLVPQDSDEQSAATLVKKIKEKRGEITDAKILKAEQMQPIRAADMAFPLPPKWRWTRLAELCELITKGSSPKWQGVSYVPEGQGILFVTSENVGSYQLIFDNRKFVEARFNEIEPRSVLRRNDLLMNIVGASIGRVASFTSDEIANINQAVCLIRLTDDALLPYLLHFLNSETCIQLMFEKQVENARANLSMGNIAHFPIPLPPLGEQERIVAKVNQLMSLCNALEARLRQQETESEKVINAGVQHVLKALNQREQATFGSS
jgi:type I restriction enzyme S subunit